MIGRNDDTVGCPVSGEMVAGVASEQPAIPQQPGDGLTFQKRERLLSSALTGIHVDQSVAYPAIDRGSIRALQMVNKNTPASAWDHVRTGLPAMEGAPSGAHSLHRAIESLRGTLGRHPQALETEMNGVAGQSPEAEGVRGLTGVYHSGNVNDAPPVFEPVTKPPMDGVQIRKLFNDGRTDDYVEHGGQSHKHKDNGRVMYAMTEHEERFHSVCVSPLKRELHGRDKQRAKARMDKTFRHNGAQGMPLHFAHVGEPLIRSRHVRFNDGDGIPGGILTRQPGQRISQVWSRPKTPHVAVFVHEMVSCSNASHSDAGVSAPTDFRQMEPNGHLSRSSAFTVSAEHILRRRQQRTGLDLVRRSDAGWPTHAAPNQMTGTEPKGLPPADAGTDPSTGFRADGHESPGAKWTFTNPLRPMNILWEKQAWGAVKA